MSIHIKITSRKTKLNMISGILLSEERIKNSSVGIEEAVVYGYGSYQSLLS